MRKYLKGLTLTELLIVLGIVLFLLAFGLYYFRNQIFKGDDARRKGDLARIQVAVEEYEKDHDCYPTPDLLDCSPGRGLNPYLDKIPCDPRTGASYFYEVDPSENCPRWYRIYSILENKNDADYLSGVGPYNSFNYFVSSANAPSLVSGSNQQGEGYGGGYLPRSDFYGCKNGSCVMIRWDPQRPGPECDPNFQNPDCLGKCNDPVAECISWK